METLDAKPFNPRVVRELRLNYTYKSGAKYCGEWKSGFRDGIGTMRWRDGALYVGEWLNSKAHGHGRFTHINGDEYFGMWANDNANNWGIFTRKEDTFFGQEAVEIEGQFKNDQQNGFCIMRVGKDGCTLFEGEFRMGTKEGWGTLKTPDGSILEGNWI